MTASAAEVSSARLRLIALTKPLGSCSGFERAELKLRRGIFLAEVRPGSLFEQEKSRQCVARRSVVEQSLEQDKALAIAQHLPEAPAREKEVLEATLKLGDALDAAGRVSDSAAKYKLTAQLAREADDTKAFIRSALGFDVAQFLSAKPLAESLQLLTEAMGKIDPNDQRSRCQLLSRLSRAYPRRE
jgi:hypothetical protein